MTTQDGYGTQVEADWVDRIVTQMARTPTDRYGNTLATGDVVFTPGEFGRAKVTAIDTYRNRGVQVQTGFYRDGSRLIGQFRWYRGDQLERVL